MSNVVEINDGNFDQEILKSEIPSIIDFWAEWCVPCKAMGPLIDEIAKEFEGRIKVGKINIDEHAEMATNLTVMNIPALIFFKNGAETGRVSGAVSRDNLIIKIQEML
ncbi:MAG: thioredoxin [Candidatus Omnitrophica bacterium]|nr:thioredoxin [Candidatus Omnitrophota bacterium]